MNATNLEGSGNRAWACSPTDLPNLRKALEEKNAIVRDLEQQIKAADKAQSKAEFLNSTKLALSLISATSEAFVDLASEFIPNKVAAKSADMMKRLKELDRFRGYAAPVGEAIAGNADGRGWADATFDAAAKGKFAQKSNVHEAVANYHANKAKLVTASLANDYSGMVVSGGKALVSLGQAMSYQILQSQEYIGSVEPVLKGVTDKFGSAVNVAAAVQKYNSDLEKAFDGYIEDTEATLESPVKGTIVRMLKQQLDRVRKLESLIVACENSLAKMA